MYSQSLYELLCLCFIKLLHDAENESGRRGGGGGGANLGFVRLLTLSLVLSLSDAWMDADGSNLI